MNNLPDNKEVKLPNSNVDVEAKIKYIIHGTYAIASECLNKETATTATIASTYNGVPVTMIGGGAFWKCISLTSVTIPSSVTKIGISTFFKCIVLKSINILSTDVSIGVNAFECPNLEKIITTLNIRPGDYGSPSTVSIINPQKEDVNP